MTSASYACKPKSHSMLLNTHLVLTLCGLTSQKTNQRGLGLSGSVHEEAHPCFPNFV